MKYIVKHMNLNIINDVPQFEEFFQQRCDIDDSNKAYSNTLIINDKGIRMNARGKQLKIDINLNKTDLYQVFNNFISYIINDENNLYLHSALISKNNKGILLLGNFGQGKTTLATKALEYGYKINSCDQTWLFYDQDKLYLKKGSIFMKENDMSYKISEDESTKKVEICKIVFLYGICEKGLFSEDTIVNDSHVIKRLFPFANWHYATPLITCETKLFNSNSMIMSFLSKINKFHIPVSIIRGDINEIINHFSSFLLQSDTDYDEAFITALKNNDYHKLVTIPKTDLHIHGALGSDRENYKNIPIVGHLDGYTGMKEYINNHLQKYMQTKEDYYTLLKNSIINAKKAGVTYMEMSIDIRYYMFFNNVESYISNLETLFQEGVELSFDIGISKGTDTKDFPLIEGLIRTRFFKGIDLYGDEGKTDLKRFLPIYELAKKYHLRRKVHVGEFSDSSLIDSSLILDPTVIQHGISIIEKKKVDAYRFITFNVCLTSNICLKRVDNIKEHPIRKMIDKGLYVTLNTDDPLIFNCNIIDEYLLLYESTIMSAEEINYIRKMGLYY